MYFITDSEWDEQENIVVPEISQELSHGLRNYIMSLTLRGGHPRVYMVTEDLN